MPPRNLMKSKANAELKLFKTRCFLRFGIPWTELFGGENEAITFFLDGTDCEEALNYFQARYMLTSAPPTVTTPN